MKKSICSIIVVFALALTSCITSKYAAGELKDQVEDNQILGTWDIEPPKEVKENDPTQKMLTGVIITAGAKPKSYLLTMPPSGQPDEKPTTFQVVIHKINGENFMSLFGSQDNKKKEYTYARYKVEGSKLTVDFLYEGKVAKNKSKEPVELKKEEVTNFADAKALRALLAKNTKGGSPNMKTSEPFVFNKK